MDGHAVLCLPNLDDCADDVHRDNADEDDPALGGDVLDFQHHPQANTIRQVLTLKR